MRKDEFPLIEAYADSKVNEVLNKIRAEIDGIEIDGQFDEHTMFIRTGSQVKQMALNIIDKYKADRSAEDGNDD